MANSPFTPTSTVSKTPVTVQAPLSDADILANMKTNAPWNYKMYLSMNPSQQATLIKWAREASSGNPPTAQEIAKDTYSWDQTQLWTSQQVNLFNMSFTNPGEYKAEQAAAQNAIANLIKTNGLNPDQATIDKATTEAFLQGWGANDPRILDLLTNNSSFNTSGTLTGKAGTAQSDFMTIAANYGIPLPKDPTQLSNFIKSALGPLGEQGFEQYAKEQAKLIYPFMSAYIDAGGTVKSYLTPYATDIANTLDISPDAINWQDPKWQSLIVKTDPSKPGLNLPASRTDVMTKLKTDVQYGYDNTKQAKQQAYTIGAQLAERFGNRAAG